MKTISYRDLVRGVAGPYVLAERSLVLFREPLKTTTTVDFDSRVLLTQSERLIRGILHSSIHAGRNRFAWFNGLSFP